MQYNPSFEEQLSRIMAYDNIVKAIKKWGIEGTEMKIKEIYKSLPQAKNFMLQCLYDMYGFGYNDYDRKDYE